MNIWNLDWKSLMLLESLLTERNVTRVAEKAGLTQPAVSNALARLRGQFNDPLLIRTRQGMVPTARGQELLVPIREAILALQGALNQSKGFQPLEAKRSFVLAMTDYVEWAVLPGLMRQLSVHAPGLKLEVQPLKERVPLRDLEEGQIDLAIGYFNPAPASLYQQELFTEDFVCVLRKDAAPPEKKFTLKEFAARKHALVSPWGGMAGLVDQILAKQGLRREVMISTSHFLTAPQVIVEGNYLVTLPRKVAAWATSHFPLIAVELPLELAPFDFRQLWHERMHHDLAHQWLRGQIAAAAKAKKVS